MRSSKLATAVFTTLIAVALAMPAMAANTESKVSKIGDTLVKWSGPNVEAVLSYRFAKNNPGESWMLLNIGITGQTGRSFEVKRSEIHLVTPAGKNVPVPTQAESAKASTGLRALLERAAIDQEPVDYWVGRRPERLGLFAVPGEAVTYDEFTVNDRLVAVGTLFFHLPAGTEPGTYQLVIDSGEAHIKIPFTLPKK